MYKANAIIVSSRDQLRRPDAILTFVAILPGYSAVKFLGCASAIILKFVRGNCQLRAGEVLVDCLQTFQLLLYSGYIDLFCVHCGERGG